MDTIPASKIEFAKKIDESEANFPYNECSSEEKSFRRHFSVRLALQQSERKLNHKKYLSVEDIADFAGVPMSTLYDWLKKEKEFKGAGPCGLKRGPKKTQES